MCDSVYVPLCEFVFVCVSLCVYVCVCLSACLCASVPTFLMQQLEVIHCHLQDLCFLQLGGTLHTVASHHMAYVNKSHESWHIRH